MLGSHRKIFPLPLNICFALVKLTVVICYDISFVQVWYLNLAKSFRRTGSVGLVNSWAELKNPWICTAKMLRRVCLCLTFYCDSLSEKQVIKNKENKWKNFTCSSSILPRYTLHSEASSKHTGDTCWVTYILCKGMSEEGQDGLSGVKLDMRHEYFDLVNRKEDQGW